MNAAGPQMKEADVEKAKEAFKLATRTTCTTTAGAVVAVVGTQTLSSSHRQQPFQSGSLER